jgi:hypothetical protein
VASYGLPQWLRISIGLPQENAAFISALTVALAEELDNPSDALSGVLSDTFPGNASMTAAR